MNNSSLLFGVMSGTSLDGIDIVLINQNNKNIRIITGYGPQDSWDFKDRIPFFTALEKEITSAELEGRSVMIAMDANSKLGKHYIKDDPHPTSENGKILTGIIYHWCTVEK